MKNSLHFGPTALLGISGIMKSMEKSPQSPTPQEQPKPQMRRQVPEDDPVYLQEIKRRSDSGDKNVFAGNAVNTYEQSKELDEWTANQNAEIASDLAEIVDKDDDYVRALEARMQRNIEHAENWQTLAEKNLRDSFVKLFKDFLELSIQSPKGERMAYARGEIKDMLAVPEMRQELQRHFGENFEKIGDIEFFHKLALGEISTDALYAAAVQHTEKFKQQEQELEEIATEAREEFKAAITEAVEKGTLPAAAAASLQRIDAISIYLSDQLGSVKSDALGSHYAEGKMSVSNFQLRPETRLNLKKTFFHEFFHELSGKSISIETQTHNIGDSTYHFHNISNVKSGVAFHGQYQMYSPNRWLNEAITEWLALGVSGPVESEKGAYQGSFSYTTEREELERLFEMGLEKELVTEAYFENISSSQPQKEKGSHFGALVKRINELEGPGGFKRLENQHIMYDIMYYMLDSYALPLREEPIAKPEDPEAKVFVMTVEVGSSEKTKDIKKFRYIFTPIVYNGVVLNNLEETRQEFKNKLSFFESKWRGKVKCKLEEISFEDAQTPN